MIYFARRTFKKRLREEEGVPIGLGSKFFHPDQVRPATSKSGKFSPKKSQVFPFGSKKSHLVGSKNTQVKNGLAPYLLQIKNMVGPGQSPSLVPTPKSSNFAPLVKTVLKNQFLVSSL